VFSVDSQDFFKILNARIEADEVPAGTVERIQKHSTCLRCIADYQKKYPGQPFKIKCEGIWEDDDITQLVAAVNSDLQPGEEPMTFEEAKENKQPSYWGERHIKLTNDDGQHVPFKARYYQVDILDCTAFRKVDRTGRGMGKTTLGIIEELHKAITRRNIEILVVTPAKAQAQKWFSDIKAHIHADPELSAALAGTPKQAPYFEFRFRNGSNIRLFCTGASSGENIRTQTPRRTRMDEQDYLAEDDYGAIQPFFRRYKNSEVHGSSTPTGSRGMYYKMCKKLADYKEFHFPITCHPDWSAEMEEGCRAEARTELVFLHEYMAEFGELQSGVFKPEYIDLALQDYRYSQFERTKKDEWKYYIGVDWNGQGTGTKIRVVGYHPQTKMRRIVDHETVDKTTMASLDAIRKMNKKWKAEEIYIDAGYGHVQDELLRLIGLNAEDDDDKRLLNIKTIDFGATIETNKLVPNRDKLLYINDDENEMSRRTKPFLVEGMQMIVEQGKFQLSRHDTILEEQMRAYRVKNYSQHGWANTYEAGKNNEIGDHDLDATMLACLAIELAWGLFYEHRQQHRLASGMEFIPGFGVPQSEAVGDSPSAQLVKTARMNAANIPFRDSSSQDQQLEARVAWLGKRSFMVSPAPRPSPSRGDWGTPGSRTQMFRNPKGR
jgi:hypothetical protein